MKKVFFVLYLAFCSSFALANDQTQGTDKMKPEDRANAQEEKSACVLRSINGGQIVEVWVDGVQFLSRTGILNRTKAANSLEAREAILQLKQLGKCSDVQFLDR